MDSGTKRISHAEFENASDELSCAAKENGKPKYGLVRANIAERIGAGEAVAVLVHRKFCFYQITYAAPAWYMPRTNVVSAKLMSPRGPGFPTLPTVGLYT